MFLYRLFSLFMVLGDSDITSKYLVYFMVGQNVMLLNKLSTDL